MRISLNLFALKNEMERKQRRTITIQEMATATGLSRQTLAGLLKDDVKAIYLDTLVSLIRFFSSEGMNVGVSDLLVLQEETKNEGEREE